MVVVVVVVAVHAGEDEARQDARCAGFTSNDVHKNVGVQKTVCPFDDMYSIIVRVTRLTALLK